MSNFLGQKTTVMVWPRIKEGRGGGTTKKILTGARKKKGKTQEKMAR